MNFPQYNDLRDATLWPEEVYIVRELGGGGTMYVKVENLDVQWNIESYEFTGIIGRDIIIDGSFVELRRGDTEVRMDNVNMTISPMNENIYAVHVTYIPGKTNLTSKEWPY